MMLEMVLECSQDFGMSNGVLPQWKRELLQRRAARTRPAPPTPPPPPPPPVAPPGADEDEELRYGPGIVKRLKSRYLSLALRDAPRRRPSVLRRAASLEHLLDERPPPAPRAAARAVAPRPQPAARRDAVKRARSVDALSRLEPRDEPPPPPSPPPPPPRPPAAPAPPVPRAPRPPRRPAPLLRDAERPPPDVVRAALRKFEPAPTRRAPAAALRPALRGLEARGSTPEPRGPPSPEAAGAEPGAPRPVSRAALEGIARAGSTTRYSFAAARPGEHLPPLAAANPVMLGRARRVGVIRPMPAPDRAPPAAEPPADDALDKISPEPPKIVEETAALVIEEMPRMVTPPPLEESETCAGRRESPPSALVEPIPRPPPDTPPPPVPSSPPPAAPESPCAEPCAPEPEPPAPEPRKIDLPKPEPRKIDLPKPEPPKPESPKPEIQAKPRAQPLVNGHSPPPRGAASPCKSPASRFDTANIESAWNGGAAELSAALEQRAARGGRGAGAGAVAGAAAGSPRGARRREPAATSVVFNFSNRKEVPDYIENDGLILRASRRDRTKAGEPGVVVLRPGGGVGGEDEGDESEEEADGGRPPSPLAVRFVNDNVLINGRSSMLPAAAARADRDRHARLKLQFDDSLTRTFEYPSETSLCVDSPCASPAPAPPAAPAPAPPAAPDQLAEPAHLAPLAANTHIVSAALARYTPHKTPALPFQLGVSRRDTATPPTNEEAASAQAEAEAEAEAGDARPCGADAARSWSDSRTLATDLLF